MAENKDSSLDVLGLKSYGEALRITVEKTFGAAEKFLGIICKPAAEELGLMFKDRIRLWRLNNIVSGTFPKGLPDRQAGTPFERERIGDGL